MNIYEQARKDLEYINGEIARLERNDSLGFDKSYTAQLFLTRSNLLLVLSGENNA